MPQNHTETEYKRKFRTLVGVWSGVYEPGKGAGLGAPDLQILVNKKLFPIELKCGKLKGRKIVASRIRPAQISWHQDFLMAGGTAYVLVCFGKIGAMHAWALPSCHRDVTSKWKEGWEIEEGQWWLRDGLWVQPIKKLVEG